MRRNRLGEGRGNSLPVRGNSKCKIPQLGEGLVWMEGRKRSQWESSMTQEEKDEREGRGRRTEGDLEKSLLHFFFLFKKIFIYLIGCTGS